MDIHNDDDEQQEVFHHHHPPDYGNYYRYDSDDFDTGTSGSDFLSRSDDEGRYDSPTETTDMEPLRRRRQPRNYKLGDTSSSSDDDGAPRAPPTQNVFQHQVSPRTRRSSDIVNSPTSPPMFFRGGMPSLARPLDPAVRSSISIDMKHHHLQDLAVESEQEGHDADVEPSDLDPMYSGHEETDDEKKQSKRKAVDGGGIPLAPPKFNVFDHKATASARGREHLSPLVLTRTRPLDSVFKAAVGSFPLLTDEEGGERRTSKSSTEIKVFDPSSPVQKRKHAVALPTNKLTLEAEASIAPAENAPVPEIGTIPSESSNVEHSVSQLSYRPSGVVEAEMEGHQSQESDHGILHDDDGFVQVYASSSSAADEDADDTGVKTNDYVNEEAVEGETPSDSSLAFEAVDSTPQTSANTSEWGEYSVTDNGESVNAEIPSEDQEEYEADVEGIDDIVRYEPNDVAGVVEDTERQVIVSVERNVLGRGDEDAVMVHSRNELKSLTHADIIEGYDDGVATPPRRNSKNNSRFAFLSEEGVPSSLKKLQDRTIRRRREMQVRMHDLECQLASVTAKLAEEKMDLDLAIRDTVDRCVRVPLEDTAERLTMEREASTIGPTLSEMGNRLNKLDMKMTKHLHVDLQNMKREELESLQDTLYQDTIPAFRIENSKSDKIEGGIVRRYEQLAGIMARQYHEECATRRAAMEDIKRNLDNVAHQDQRQLEDFLSKIEDIRTQLRNERSERIAADKRMANEIAKNTAAMKRALLAAVGNGS